MAIPVLYWMLGCTECASRRVVHDSYLEYLGTSARVPPAGAGYGGPPLPERYDCLKGCLQELRAVGAISTPEDRILWLNEPPVPIAMNQHQLDEWSRLIEDAGLD